MPRLRRRSNNLTPSASSTRPAATSNYSMSRPRRGAAAAAAAAASVSATVDREGSSSRSRSASPERKRLRLTVKAAPSKLREATSSNTRSSGGRTSLLRGRSKKTVVEESSEEEEEEDEDEDEMDADADEDVEMDDQDDDDDDDDEEDADGEEDEPVAPTPAAVAASRKILKPSVIVTLPRKLLPVEAKEIAMGDASDDEELSELDSDEAEDMEEDEELGEEDAEGEEEPGEEDAEGEDEELDSDEDGASEGGTPDMSKLTRRQRAVYDESLEGGLMALSNEAQKKKHLTAEELTMRRAEMARRRKNLSEKRNEEEKMDTINRLLKKQAPKRRGKAAKEPTTAADAGDSGAEDLEPEPERAPALYTHYIQNADGVSLGVPHEWLDSPFGTTFANPVKAQSSRPFTGRMVEEVS
ncbi:hypothetical protein EJ05DRAFT_483127 [Pseudovirgaria hyperparasitica]|uniref:INO80 complex subunit B-like conserved region domain-containing protein n=1 Tax=Pseudovirgaria hyperparasitica TaxID=470096 RepID=A0A6A6WJK2_9PEZI|nr:uncharacterized protein EJ05DRAFT_483127 [Pseudovirgaria hyperparasitica]KAF2762380.1 hypothetical protein EJ05DRAFT_483127 [Pseudovirgaria hyperparasitica]